jgi:hypothetical protein
MAWVSPSGSPRDRGMEGGLLAPRTPIGVPAQFFEAKGKEALVSGKGMRTRVPVPRALQGDTGARG